MAWSCCSGSSDQPQQIAVVLLTAQGSIDVAVDAMKAGAYDFIQKPVDPARLKQILQNAARQRGTVLELEVTKRKLRDTGLFGNMVGSSRAMQEIFHLIEMVAPSTASVLITGESGTGKEMVARTIHDMSPRKNKPFVAINCSAIPETLIESEIFGHEKGAFTGALERRAGCFELAEEGTLLLDEIGEMPAATQAKLLRVLGRPQAAPPGQQSGNASRRAGSGGNQQGSGRCGRKRGIARRSLLPPQRLQYPHASAARSQRRRSSTGGGLAGGHERQART